MDNLKVMPGTSKGGGPSAISVVVTSASETPTSSDTTRRRISPIKLVGVGGLERQNYCCGHWFPSSKSYHRHLAEKALVDLTHEMRLIELGMLRCAHCSMWVHVDSMSGHIRKSHGIIKVNKNPKFVPNSKVSEITGISRDTLKTGANFVIKVSGQSAVKSSNVDISCTDTNTVANSSTVRLVTTSSGSLYHKVHQFQHSGIGNVIVQKSTNQLPVICRGPRIVMKSVGRSVIPLSNASKILSPPDSSQTVPTTTTTAAARNVNGITTVKISGGSILSSSTSNPFQACVVKPQEKLPNANGQNFKLIKKIANIKSKNKTTVSQNAIASPSVELSVCTKTKEKGKATSSGETLSLKPSQVKKSRKQVLKPSLPDTSYVAETSSLSANGKMKKRGKKNSAEPEIIYPEKTNSSSPSINHKGYRRKSKEMPDSENYTPKISRHTPKGAKGGCKKKKKGPGRPRKINPDETPDLSELDSLFDEVNKEDLENEPVAMTKKEDENVPTVELDLFTLPSLNEQVSVLLTEPQNPNFKVYASMDAIFVGDSALGDVTNQIGYITDANNVVYVNPGHFLFPNVEDLENFVPSPILTMKGGKIGITPVRQIWKLNSNKANSPVVLRDIKFTSSSNSKEASSSDVSSVKVNVDNKDSQAPFVSAKQKVNEKVLKKTSAMTNQVENILHVKPLRIVKPNVDQDVEDTKTNNMKDAREAETSVVTKEQNISKPAVSTSPKVRSARRPRNSQASDEKEDNKINSDDSIPEKSSKDDVSLIGKSSVGQNQDVNTHQSDLQSNLVDTQEFDLESWKSPEKVRKKPILAPDITKVLKLPSVSDMEGSTTKEEEVSASLTPTKLNSGTSVESEESACISPFKSSNIIVTQKEITDDSGLPLKSNSQPINSPCKSLSTDALITNKKENITDEALRYSPQPETNKVSCEKDVNLFRRIRRRSRTKSADTVHKSSLGTNSDVESGCSDDNSRHQSRRKTRQLSESSITFKEIRLNEGDRLTVSDMTYRLRMEHLPLRLSQQNGNKEVDVKDNVLEAECCSSVDQMSYPLTPRNTKTSHSSAEFSAIQSDSLENEIKCSLKRKDNREMHVSMHNEGESKTPVRLGRQRRRSSKLLESLGIQPLKPDSNNGVIEGTAVVEDISKKSVKERLSGIETIVETRSVRERRPSSKLQDSMEVISKSPKRTYSPHSAEQQLCTVLVDQSLIQRQKLVDTTEKLCLTQIDMLLNKTEEERSLSKENLKAKSPKAEQLSPVSPLKESDLSPSREWHGRGAKLKAQVLIQDQQAGVTDSQIIPSIPDVVTYSTDTSVMCSSNESLSPKIVASTDSETQVTPSIPQPKPPTMTSSPTSPKASKSPKSPKSPRLLQDREWQARGAKLKAQIMISDQQNSAVEDTEEAFSHNSSSVALPPNKKIKFDSPPGANRDIRSFFSVQKSPVHKSDENKSKLTSPVNCSIPIIPVCKKKKINISPNVQNDIRSFFSSASVKRKSSSPQMSSTKVLKTEETSMVNSHKKSPKEEDLCSVQLPSKECEVMENRAPQVSSLPVASWNFEGFDRCSRQSGLRAKSLMRLVSLLSMKRWYHIGKFPFPLDQLCDWDDEMLSYLIFDSN